MGILSKLKGVFYDEVVVEEDDNTKELSKLNKKLKKEKEKEEKREVKVETSQPVVEIPKIEEIKYRTVDENIKSEPVVEEKPKTENTFSERDLFRSDRTFDFVEFNETEEKEMELPKRNVLSEENRGAKVDSQAVPDTPRVFKPTPIISPIWGVLDKDYKKEEIKDKVLPNDTLNTTVTTYDTVRRKAYGTLEDELEDTLNSINKISTETINKEAKKANKEADYLDQKTAKIEDLISKIEEETKDIDKDLTIGELEDEVKLDHFDDEEEDDDKTVSDNTLEHDLFNLIDSMYDKED